MILQCDQCTTRFRLDDAKLKPGGVKVRCSKCHHVFLAGAELKQEDSEFDAILSGLGAAAPEKREEAVAHLPGECAAGFTFDDESDEVPAVPEPDAAAAAAAAGDAPPPAEEPASRQEVDDFAAFEFPAEPFASQEQPTQEQPVQELPDFGEFAFDEEPVAIREEPASAPDGALDFGEFSFTAPAASQQEPTLPALAGLDFGDVDLDDEPDLKAPPVALDDPDFGAFSFAEEPAILKEEAAPVADNALSFGEFSFIQDIVGKEGAEKSVASPSPADTALPAAPPLSLSMATETAEPLKAEAAPDFDCTATPVPTRIPEEEFDDGMLPPLSIASRRKGRSLLTVSIVAISVLVIVALSGAGLYLLQSGPAAFDKLGLGFVAKWFGMESTEEGRVTIRNPLAAFYQNKEAGEIFVVTGEAVNSFRKARASIHVKVSLFDKKGAVLLQRSAYCGNRLSKEQLETVPMAKIESIMNNQFGDSLANLGVQPGSAIGFVVVMANVPKEAVDFGVEVTGSTVAGK